MKAGGILAVVSLVVAGVQLTAQAFQAGDFVMTSATSLPQHVDVAHGPTGSPTLLFDNNSGKGFAQILIDRDHYAYAPGFFFIQKFDAQGNLLATWPTRRPCLSGVFTGDGSLIVAYDSPNGFDVFDRQGHVIRSINGPANPASPDAIDLAADQCTLYYATGRFGAVDLCRGTDLFQKVGIGAISDVRVLPDGSVLAAWSGGVYRFTASGDLLRTYSVSSANIALAPDGKSFWSNKFTGGALYQVDLDSGAILQTVTYPNFVVSRFAIVGDPHAALNSPAIPVLRYEQLIALALIIAAAALLRLRPS